jgi:hypothetical protein
MSSSSSSNSSRASVHHLAPAVRSALVYTKNAALWMLSATKSASNLYNICSHEEHDAPTAMRQDICLFVDEDIYGRYPTYLLGHKATTAFGTSSRKSLVYSDPYGANSALSVARLTAFAITAHSLLTTL